MASPTRPCPPSEQSNELCFNCLYRLCDPSVTPCVILLYCFTVKTQRFLDCLRLTSCYIQHGWHVFRHLILECPLMTSFFASLTGGGDCFRSINLCTSTSQECDRNKPNNSAALPHRHTQNRLFLSRTLFVYLFQFRHKKCFHRTIS